MKFRKFDIFKLLFVLLQTITFTSAAIDVNNPLARKIVLRSKVADIKSWMEPAEDPCNNFFRYACGTWDRINSATNIHVYGTDKFQDVTAIHQRKVDYLLNHKKTGDPILDKLRDFYESCRNVIKSPQEYIKNLQAIYKDYGDFTFVEEREKRGKSNLPPWWKMVAQVQKLYGRSVVFAVNIRMTSNDSSVMHISIPDFLLVQPHKRDEILQFLQKFYNVSVKKSEEIFDEIYDIEMLLMQGGTDARSGKTFSELLTLYETKDFISKYSDLMDVEEFLKISLNISQLPSQIYVFDEDYFVNLINVMKEIDPHHMRDYILWYTLDDFMLDTETKDWDSYCSSKTKQYFGKYLDYHVYQEYRSKEIEYETKQLWHEIKSAFRENLLQGKYTWLSPDVRDYTVKKLDMIKLNINSYDDENFEEYFQGLYTQPENYVRNLQNTIIRWQEQRYIARQTGGKQKSSHGIGMSSVMSYTPVYNTLENEVYIPVGLLSPFYLWHPVYPSAIKYSTMGFLLAHEMIHAFDDSGHMFDIDGEVNDWWDDNTLQEFEQRRECFQEQYHKLIYSGINLPSSVAQAENIADNAAVKLSYQAYMSWYNGTTNTNETFENLPVNNKKLFFINMAQLWCTDVHEDHRISKALDDDHAPSMLRVIGVLSNFKEFSNTFNCKSGSNMNPVKKCEVY